MKQEGFSMLTVGAEGASQVKYETFCLPKVECKILRCSYINGVSQMSLTS
jgi:hypothetical protein